MKKILALILALVMVFSMGTAVFAEGEGTPSNTATGNGTITIINATVGKTYSAYKMFDLKFDASDPEKVSYTLTKNSDTEYWYDYLTDASGDSPFTLSATTTDNLYTVSIKSGKSKDDVITWLTSEDFDSSKLPTAIKTEVATESEIKWEGIPYGYYYISTNNETAVTVNSTLPDVEVIDKNEDGGWDIPDDPENPNEYYGKVIVENGENLKENTANFGDTVEFNIGVRGVAYKKGELVTYYWIKDTIENGFSYNKDATVTITDSDGNEIELNEVSSNPEAGEYKITYDTDGKSFEIYIPVLETEEISDTTDYKYTPAFGTKFNILVDYTADVTEDAVIADPGNPNTANYYAQTTTDFDPDVPSIPEEPTPTPPTGYEEERETTTYVYALGLLKVDEDGNTLTGAKFSVKDSDGNLVCATGSAGLYKYDTESEVTEFEVDANGQLVIEGLKAEEYKVTETLAPQGYNLCNSFKMTPVIKTAYTSKIRVYFDENGKVTEDETENYEDTELTANVNVLGKAVKNLTGSELPSTGGTGTTMFYIIGAILALGAVVVLIARKRVTD